MEHEILIDEDGRIQHVYDDALAGLFDGEGDARVARASHVEPAGDWCPHCGTVERRFADCAFPHITRGWMADMRPVGGPVLLAPDGEGFATRQAALDAERAWLSAQLARRTLSVR